LAGCVAAALVSVVAALPSGGAEFPLFPYRNVRSLNGRWAFAWLGGSVADPTTFDPRGVPTPMTVVVPSSMDTFVWDGLSLWGAHGTGVYRTQIATQPGTWARIRFGACGFFCSVWVDGVQVRLHAT
jgi:hypothetical protein